jgi:hypothetical protein
MIGMTALLLATSISGTADGIFRDGMEGDVCPDGRIVQSDILYGDVTLTDVDVTLFENVWGYLTSSDPLTLWPGINGSTPMILDFTKTGYLAAKFHTLSDPPALLTGMFKYTSYPFMGPALDLSISGQCGDFSAELAGCVALNIPPVDQAFVHWRFSAGNPFMCQLQPDTDYYVNVRFTDPTATAPQCSDVACPVPISNYFGE